MSMTDKRKELALENNFTKRIYSLTNKSKKERQLWKKEILIITQKMDF